MIETFPDPLVFFLYVVSFSSFFFLRVKLSVKSQATSTLNLSTKRADHFGKSHVILRTNEQFFNIEEAGSERPGLRFMLYVYKQVIRRVIL